MNIHIRRFPSLNLHWGGDHFKGPRLNALMIVVMKTILEDFALTVTYCLEFFQLPCFEYQY